MEKEVKFVLTAEDLASPVIDRFWKQVQGMQKDVNVGLNVQTNAPSSSSGSSSSSPNNTSNDFTDLSASVTESRQALDEFTYALTQLIDKLSSAGSSSGGGLPSGVNKSDVAGDFTTVDVAKRFKSLHPEKKGEGGGGDSQISEMGKMLSTENGNMLRALGQYRIAWLSSMPKGSPAMGIAAGAVIVGAIMDMGQKIIDQLSQASPILRAEFKVLRVAIDQLLRPIGDLLGAVLRPLSRGMLMANAKARLDIAKEGGDQNDLGNYYKHYFAELAGMGLGMDTSGIEKLTEAFGYIAKFAEALLALTSPLATAVIYQKELNDAIKQATAWYLKWFAIDDPKTKEDESGILFKPFTHLGDTITTITKCFDDLKAPIDGLSSLISNIPGIKIASALTGGGGGSSTTNNNWSGGINVIVKSSKDAGKSVTNEIGGWMRGVFG